MENNDNFKSKINLKAKELLLRLGITPDLSGYQCAAVAITELYCSGKTVSHRQTQDGNFIGTCELCKKCAQKMNIPSTSVERALRYITLKLEEKNKLEHFEKILGCKINGNITVSVFLSLCVERLFIEDERKGLN